MRISAVIFAVCCTVPVWAADAYFYNRNGTPAGRSRTSGNTTYYYDKNGTPAGRVRH